MKEKETGNPVILDQVEGKQVNLEESVTLESPEAAIQLFNTACHRLMHPGGWHELAGTLSAFFKVESFNRERTAKENDYLQIDLPAPGNPAGDGHDWVKVEAIAKNTEPGADESITMTLRTSENPAKPHEGVAHFFDEGATSSFVIYRKGNEVIARYHGRNEKPNTKEGGFGTKFRNVLVAIGALAGFSEVQWKSLLKGFLSNKSDT